MKMIISIFAVFLSLATVGVLGVNLEQTKLSLTKNVEKSVYITCTVTGLSSSYVHWYHQKENEPLKRILYTDKQGSIVPDTEFQDAKDFKVKVDKEVYNLKIDKVKESHSGVYYCASWDTSSAWVKVFGAGTRLYVTERPKKAPEVSVYPVSNQQADDKRVLLCQARNMFPDLVRFTWEVKDQNGAKVDLTDNDEVLEQRDEPLESQITSMLITDQQKAMQYTYTCSVQHEDGPTIKEIQREKKEKPTITCPPSTRKEKEEVQEDSFIDGSTELSRSAYLFSITYVMLLVKNVLYFCTVSVSLYKRSADNEEMLFGKVR